jgi:riboflavin kinase
MTASNTENNDSSMLSVEDKLPLRMISTVVRGFGRGSSDLGIPTANLDRDSGKYTCGSFEELPTGIYWGFCRIGKTKRDVYIIFSNECL